MTIAIVHYHLRTGGVTTVIEATSAALTAAGLRHVILTGEASSLSSTLPVKMVEGLGYAAGSPRAQEDSDGLASRLRTAAAEALGQAPDVWHFHNHSLGKNPLTGRVVERFAREGDAMVLQCHDFAEDGRPQNLALLRDHARLYPAGPRIHYALLNSADRERLIRCGLRPDQASVLPNPITVPSPALPPPDPAGDPLVLYPVRAIPRKNIGELLLLAALSPAGTRYAISRAPENPEWLESYHDWCRFSETLGLPIDFGVVDRLPPPGGPDATFESWVRAASHFVTTSLAEGFGMVFLEAAAKGRPMFGRNLPQVTRDHAAVGLQAGRLYDQLIFAGCGGADFGTRPKDVQQSAIRRLRDDPASAAAVSMRVGGIDFPAAEWLAETLRQREPTIRPAQLAAFSPAACVGRLTAVYRKIEAAPVAEITSHLDREMIRECFRRRG